MDKTEYLALPWDVLKQTHGDIPRSEIQQFADALAADSKLLAPLMELFDGAMDEPYADGRFLCVYIPAIIALAAPGFDEKTRAMAAEWLVDSLIEVCEEEYDMLQELLTFACGRLGPAVVLPIAMRLMPADFMPWSVSRGLWHLMTLVKETEQVFLRARVVDFCTTALQQAVRGTVRVECVDGAAWVIARIGIEEARPLLEQLVSQSDCPAISNALKFMDGSFPHEFPLEWEESFEELLEDCWGCVTNWDDPMDDMEAEEQRSGELARRFAESSAVAELPDPMRENAEYIAGSLLNHAVLYEGVQAEELDELTLRNILLDAFPRKVCGDEEVFESAVPVSQVLLIWLQDEGILPDGRKLSESIADLGLEVATRCADPALWGMGKGIAMLARDRGVDMSNREEVDQFIIEYNRMVKRGGIFGTDCDDSEDYLPVVAPIVNESPKIGRNEPCPCGSGKKHKKCCGRSP